MNKIYYFLIIFSFAFLNSAAADEKTKVIATSDLKGRKINITLGSQETLLPAGSFKLDYFPDVSVTLLSRDPYRIIFAAGNESYLLEGSDLKHFNKSTKILWRGRGGAYDNGYAGISGIYFHNDGKIYCFYHAEDQENMQQLYGGGDISGFYARIAVIVSENNGLKWKKLGPVIESSKPKEWTFYKDHQDRGAGEPGAVPDKTGKYLYLYYTEHSRQEGRGVQICMARAKIDKDPPLPGTWMKYYRGGFTENGLKGLDTPVISAKNMDDAEAVFPHPVYSGKLDLYIMIFNINFWKEYVYNTGLKNSGIYIAYSGDGIKWSKPYLLVKDNCMPLPGKSISWQANIIWDEKSDAEGWLVYGYSEKWGHRINNMVPHYMAGRRISFRKEQQH